MTCLTITQEIKGLAAQIKGETVESVKGLIALWQEAKHKDMDDYPTLSELRSFMEEIRTPNLLEKIARPDFKGKMSFSYGNQKAEGITAETTLEAIKLGERTATTRYSKDGNISYWEKVKKGDIIEFSDNNGNRVHVKVTKPLHKLPKTTTAEEWSAKEGWSISRFEQRVKPEIEKGTAYQMEFEYIDTSKLMAESYLEESSKEESKSEQVKKEPLTEEHFETEPLDTPVITMSDRKKANMAFTAQVRRDRVSLIGRLFSKEVDAALKELRANLTNRIQQASPKDAIVLRQQLETLDRKAVISYFKPVGIFNRVKEIFAQYVNYTDEERINSEANVIRDTLRKQGNLEKYSEEQIIAAATKKANYKYEQYQKVLDNFNALAEEASTIIATNEFVIIDIEGTEVAEVSESETITDEGVKDSENSIYNKEESVKDGWMTNFREVSGYDSLTMIVRKALSKIPKLNNKGKYEKDDLGFPRYLDSMTAYTALANALNKMLTAEDMMPILTNLAKTKKWVNPLIDALNKDEILFSQFYQTFRKDKTNYWIQRTTTDAAGKVTTKTIPVNRAEGVSLLLEDWRETQQSRTLLSKDSIYNQDGSLNKENAQKGLNLISELANKLNNKSSEERIKIFSELNNWETVIKALNMVGIDVNTLDLMKALTNISTDAQINVADPIMDLIQQLNIIFKGVSKNAITKRDNENTDLIRSYSSAYSNIASMLNAVMEDSFENSTREGDKTYQTYTTPNYLGKILKNLKNVYQNEARFKQFMREEFQQYDWFYKHGKWRNSLLQELFENPKARQELEHKVLLNVDKKGYSQWDSLDCILALLNEYGLSRTSTSADRYAWYHIPILGDAQSAEFLRLRRYSDGDELNEQGFRMSYKDIILNKLVDVVNQEYDRIMLVRQRWEGIKNGTIKPIENFDISVDKKTGNLKLGGAEFKFFPRLNTLKGSKNTLFIDELSKALRERSADDVKALIKSSLEYIIEEDFENACKHWKKLGVFDEVADSCKYLPFVSVKSENTKLSNALKTARTLISTDWTANMESLLQAATHNEMFNDKRATKIVSSIKDILNAKVAEGVIRQQEAQNIIRNLNTRISAKEALREYFYNSQLATTQIIQVLSTDLAYYKNLEDFQKRFKQVHAPSIRMNTSATYKGETIGRKVERTIYLTDEIIESPNIADIEEILIAQGVSKLDRDFILSQFKKVNVTDAQAYRSLSSYRAILGMSGQWNDDLQRAFENFYNGTWDAKDFGIIFQTKKPFVYTQTTVRSGVENSSSIKVPVQHKNSEFLLLAAHAIAAGKLGKSSKLKAINKFMEERNIDVVQFESTTKVGKQGAIDLSSATTEEEVGQLLLEKTGIGSGQENPEVVHIVSYEDYGIQNETPEHHLDREQLIGTQFGKLITADIADDAILGTPELIGILEKFPAKSKLPIIDKTVEEVIKQGGLTKKQWLDLYNAIRVENIIQSYDKVRKKFSDVKEVVKSLKAKIKSDSRYSRDLLDACELNAEGKPNLPFFDPVQSTMVESLLNSIIKSEVTKQKIKGGTLIQVSAFGLSEDLHIVYEGAGKNKRIKYFECYMPAYSKEFYEPLMDPETHELDISKLPEGLRRAIGYRIPTEDKYSMVPLRIKGFLPQYNGSAIMLPAEITTLSGSDFDIDKLYVMLPEFRIQRYDKREAREDYAKENKDFQDVMAKFHKSELAQELLSIDTPNFNTWFNERKDQYKLTTPKIVKIEYDYTKSPQENSLQARNNLIIDLAFNLLTSPDTASKILHPGGFDEQKRVGRINTILLESTMEQITKALNEVGYKSSNPIQTLLNIQDLDVLTGIADKLKITRNPLSPATYEYLHQQNTTGSKLIGVYATHNANHALIQHTTVELHPTYAFTLNGKSLTSLHQVKNAEGNFISRNNAGYLAASVDNVKDPVLALLNQNSFTADATMLLSRLGYTPLEIGLLMQQPIIRAMTNSYLKNPYSKKIDIVKEVLDEWHKNGNIVGLREYSEVKTREFSVEELANNIINGKGSIDSNFYQNQISVGLLYRQILKSSEELADLVRVIQNDTDKGAAGPSIADTQIKLLKAYTFADKSSSSSSKKNPFPLVNTKGIIGTNVSYDKDIDRYREELLESELSINTAFFTGGLLSTDLLLGAYFPQYSGAFNDVVESMLGFSKTGQLNVKTLKSIYNDLFTYILSKNHSFGAEKDIKTDKVITAKEKRDYYIKEFPNTFKKIVDNNPDIADLGLIKSLKVTKYSNSPISAIVFKNVGKLKPQVKESFMRDWETLLDMKNPVANKLAISLFKYNYYRTGLGFGPNSFGHLAPTAVRLAVPEYISTLEETLNDPDTWRTYAGYFITQYVYNHLDNNLFVVKLNSPAIVQDTKTNILNDVIIPVDKVPKELVSATAFKGGKLTAEYHTFFSVKVGGSTYYYKKFGGPETLNNLVHYKRVTPLGVKNQFLEYEFGKSVEDITPILGNQDIKVSDNLSEDLDGPSTEDGTDFTRFKEKSEDYTEVDAANDAMKSLYGVSPENAPKEDGAFDSEPNNEWKDANDENVCGANRINYI